MLVLRLWRVVVKCNLIVICVNELAHRIYARAGVDVELLVVSFL